MCIGGRRRNAPAPYVTLCVDERFVATPITSMDLFIFYYSDILLLFFFSFLLTLFTITGLLMLCTRINILVYNCDVFILFEFKIRYILANVNCLVLINCQ